MAIKTVYLYAKLFFHFVIVIVIKSIVLLVGVLVDF